MSEYLQISHAPPPATANRFKESVLKRIEGVREVAGRLISAGSPVQRHKDALYHRLLEHVRALDEDDHALSALQRLQIWAGGGSGEWQPTTAQNRILASTGSMGMVDQQPAELIGELIIAGIEDSHKARDRERVAKDQRDREEMRRQIEQRYLPEVERLQNADATQKGEIQALKAELAKAKQDRDYALSHLDVSKIGTNGSGDAEDEEPYRRRKTDHAGVYETKRSDGTIAYEIGFPDPEKPRRTKFETVGPDLEEAVAERERRMATAGQG